MNFNVLCVILHRNGVHICVGAPSKPYDLPAFELLGGRKSVSASGIGGLPETQEKLDYCVEHNIVSDVELSDMNYIQEAYKRMLKGDVRCRFVIDMALL